MGKKSAIPTGWLKYQPLGKCIEGTKIVAFKVPLRLEVLKGRLPEEEWFTPAILLEREPRLKMVIDLTNTDRYYRAEVFRREGVSHVKIFVEGGGHIPPTNQVSEFFSAVDEFLETFSDNPDALVGVHCTHGLNRTGYFVCSYLVERLKMLPAEAIEKFEAARGHKIERLTLVRGIQSLDPAKSTVPPVTARRQYITPFDEPYREQEPAPKRERNRHRKQRPNQNKAARSGSRSSNVAYVSPLDDAYSRDEPNSRYRIDRRNRRGQRREHMSRADLDDNWRKK